MLMEDLYRSEAEIRVLYGTSGPIGRHRAERSVALVRDRITENSLEQIIVDGGLFPQVGQTGPPPNALNTMRNHISLSAIQEDVVRLAFESADPLVAHKVVSHLASLYDDLVVQQVQDRATKNFSDDIKAAESELAKQEKKVRDFNLQFLGGHLEKQTATLASLNRLILKLQSNSDLLSALQEQKSDQERILTQEEGRSSPKSAEGPAELQPDSSSLNASPTLSEAQRKIEQFSKEIDLRKKQQAEIRQEMARYQAKVDSAPNLVSLQTAIARDYQKASQHYEDLLAKKNENEVAKAARKTSTIGFLILSPASVPDAPSNRLVQFIARFSGLLLGPLIGMGLVIWQARRAEQNLTLEQVITDSGVSVLASIPWIEANDWGPNRDFDERAGRTLTAS